MNGLPGSITKEYPRRGPWQQFRFDRAVEFVCSRCGRGKKAKLVTIIDGDWNRLLCNGCYGFLLSARDPGCR